MKCKICILFIFIIVFSCNNGTQTEPTERSKEKTNSQNVIVKYAHETAITGEDMSVKFEAILEDSRCPEGVQCVWAGNARIELAVTKAGEDTASLELNTNDRYPVEAHYLDYTITLIDLKPYPKAAEQKDIENYTATIEIQKP